jgi:short subunit dehydrogenase-like uncharacterized protein
VAAIAVLGATGQTGRLVVEELLRRGHDVLAGGPDLTSLHERVRPLGERVEPREADAHRPETLASLLADAEALISTAGTHEELGRGVLEAALHAGVHYLDASLEQDAALWAYEHDERARRAGVTALPGAGFPTVPLDLLAHLAYGAVTGGEDLHLAVTAPNRGGLRAAAGPGARRAIAGMLGQPVTAWVDGRAEREPLGEARRLAWFPRPVGPAHAAGIPAVASVSVPRHCPDVRTVRTYLALSSARAEALQLAGNAARWEPARRRLQRWARGRGGEPTARRRDEVTWAAVAETQGVEGVARAWANGRDPAALTAVGLVALAEQVVVGSAPAGVLAPAEVEDPGELLDLLAARGDLRWSITRPG